jgi:hypothetical protein
MTMNNACFGWPASAFVQLRRLREKVNLSQLHRDRRGRRSMQLSLYHETSPVKTPFHVCMLAPPRPESDRVHIYSLKPGPSGACGLVPNRGLPAANLIPKPHAPCHNPIQTIPATEIHHFETPVCQKATVLGYLQKCRGTFARASRHLALFLLPTLAIRRVFRSLLLFLRFEPSKHPVLVRPGIHPANGTIIALLTGGS